MLKNMSHLRLLKASPRGSLALPVCALVLGLSACKADSSTGANDAGGIADASALAVDAAPEPDSSAAAWVEIVTPPTGAEVENPVVLTFTAGGDIHWVRFEADGWPLQDDPIAASQGSHEYTFSGVGYERTVLLMGYGEDQHTVLATAEVRFTVVDPAPTLVFPLADEPGLVLSAFDDPASTADFGAARSGGRIHAGCDLYWRNDGGLAYQTSYYQYNNNTPIYAVADGVITDYYYFYQGTNALVVDHGDFVVRYGEVDDNGLPGGLGVGSAVTAGQHIADMGDLDMSSGTWSMLHFELYSGDLTGPLSNSNNWTYLHVPDANYQRRGDLMDCGPFLRALVP